MVENTRKYNFAFLELSWRESGTQSQNASLVRSALSLAFLPNASENRTDGRTEQRRTEAGCTGALRHWRPLLALSPVTCPFQMSPTVPSRSSRGGPPQARLGPQRVPPERPPRTRTLLSCPGPHDSGPLSPPAKPERTPKKEATEKRHHTASSPNMAAHSPSSTALHRPSRERREPPGRRKKRV